MTGSIRRVHKSKDKMRPTIEDVPPFYRPYLAKVEGDNVEWILTQARQETLSVLENIDEAKANYAYADGKWTIKSLIQHIVDSEVVFSFRGLWIARNADGPLLGFEQDDWVAEEIKNEKSSINFCSAALKFLYFLPYFSLLENSSLDFGSIIGRSSSNSISFLRSTT